MPGPDAGAGSASAGPAGRDGGFARAALPIAAVAVSALFAGAVLAAAGDTLGYDFLAYWAAARRAIEGQAIYDLTYQRAGGFGLFLYPPTFLPLVLPFGLLSAAAATWAWIAAMTAALLAGIRLLPVPVPLRWAILLLAGLDWPVLYTLKLGQVTPLLFLLAVLGWRGVEAERERPRLAPRLLGAAAAVGAAIKLQPGLLLAWAAVTGRWRALLAGIATLVLLAVVATLVAGLPAWWDYVSLIRQVTDPVTTEHNVTPGWVAHGLGLSAEAAGAVQLGVVALALGAVLLSTRVSRPAPSYLLALTASQVVSPVLWDHYAMLLLLPVAWLLADGRRWAALIPLATSLPLVPLTPLAAYPVLFGATAVALLAAGRDPRGLGGTRRRAPAGAAAA